jgi:hypothetical protein
LRHVATLERLASGRRLLDRRAEHLMLATRATTGFAVGQLRTAKAGRTLRCAPVFSGRWRLLGLARRQSPPPIRSKGKLVGQNSTDTPGVRLAVRA